MKAIFLACCGLLFSGRAGNAGPAPAAGKVIIAQAYDQSFTIELPDGWQRYPLEKGRSDLAGIILDAPNRKSTDPAGLVIEDLSIEGYRRGNIKKIAAAQLERARAQHPKDSIGPLHAQEIAKTLSTAYAFQTGGNPEDFTFVFFSLGKRNYKAAYPNRWRYEARKALGTITPTAR